MILDGIECLKPSKKINNDEIVDLVRYYSSDIFEGDLERTLEDIRSYLTTIGSKTRFWRSKNERPIDMIFEAVKYAFRYANISKRDLDLIIYVGIDRGFIEPANASFIAKKIGTPFVRTFDIVDACMGWCTALNVVQSMIVCNQINNALIVSSEFSIDEGGSVFPGCFSLKNEKELMWKLPAFTLGEAVSATIVVKRENSPWKFLFSSNSKYADLCTVPLYKHHEYSDPSVKIDSEGGMKFSAFGTELAQKGFREAIRVLKKLTKNTKEPKFIFPHSVSKKIYERASKRLNMEAKVYSTFEDFGNIATSSIPSAIARAIKRNDLKRGDLSIGWIASAGMKFSAFEILY